MPEAKQRFLELGGEPAGGPVESFAQRFHSDYRMWGQVIRDSGIRLE